MDVSRAHIFLRISRLVAFGFAGDVSFALGPFSINLQTVAAPALPAIFLGTIAYLLYREFDEQYYLWSTSRALAMAARLDEEEEENDREREAILALFEEHKRLSDELHLVLVGGSNVSRENDGATTRLDTGDAERKAEISRRIDDIFKEVMARTKSWTKQREKLLEERQRLHLWLSKLKVRSPK